MELLARGVSPEGSEAAEAAEAAATVAATAMAGPLPA